MYKSAKTLATKMNDADSEASQPGPSRHPARWTTLHKARPVGCKFLGDPWAHALRRPALLCTRILLIR